MKSQKLFVTLALVMLTATATWAENHEGWSSEYRTANGLTFHRNFTSDDPAGKTLTLIRAKENNIEHYGSTNQYGQTQGNWTSPGEGQSGERLVGPTEYTEETYVIPAEVDGMPVVAMNGDVFKDNQYIKSITFATANLTVVAGGSFSGSTIETLNFAGSSIKEIGIGAFANCTALKEIADWGNVETIHGGFFGPGAFGNCTALAEIRIGPSVKYIYGNAFGGNPNVTRLIFEDGDALLELSAGGGNEGGIYGMFYDSPITYVYYGRKLASNIHDGYRQLSNPLCLIKDEVMATIERMDVEFGEPVDSMYNCIFKDMKAPLYVKAPSTTYIGSYAFENANLKSLDMPKIKKIDSYAFVNCLLTDLKFYSVEEIGNYAFKGARLQNISLPATLKFVGLSAFSDEYTDYDDKDYADAHGYYPTKSCLKSLRIEDGDDPIELGFNRDEYENYTNKDETSYDWTVYVYSGAWLKSQTLEELYIGRPVGHEPVINEFGSASKYASALSFTANNFPKLKKAELTKVTTISNDVFYASSSEYDPASNLEEVSLPLLKVVPKECFYNCAKLKKVNIPKAETLWDKAFAYTSGDLDVSFINNVDSIKEECFAYSGISGELTIPGTVKYLGRAVFNNCENLKKITFAYGEKPLGMEYFWKSNGAYSGIMSIGGNKCGIEEFYFDRNIEPFIYTDYQGYNYTYRFEIAISDGSNGSMGFPNLKNVTIGKNLTSLNGYTFVSRGLEFIRCENPEPIAMEYTTYEGDDSFNADHSQGPSFNTYVQQEVKLLVPDGSVSKYLAADVWKGFLNLTDDQGNLGTIAITVPAEGITTYSGLHNLDFSAQTDVKPYIVTSYDADNGTAQLSEVANVSLLNLNYSGVVIKGKPGTYQIPVVTTKSAYLNMLEGAPSNQVTLNEEGYTYYNYSSSSTTTYNCYLINGQFKRSDGSVKVGPNAAYLKVPKTMSNSKKGSNVTVTLGNDAFTPLYPEVSLNFTDVEGLEAYCVTGFTGSGTVTLTRVNKVGAYEFILLKGTPGATYTIPSEKFKVINMNMLQMNTGESDITIQNSKSSYSLYLYLDGDKFKIASEDGTTIAPGRAYLYTLSAALDENGPEEYAIVCRQPEDISVNGLNGDANGDGKINASDIVAIVAYLTSGQAPQGFSLILADADNSGNVTEADVKAVADKIMSRQ